MAAVIALPPLRSGTPHVPRHRHGEAHRLPCPHPDGGGGGRPHAGRAQRHPRLDRAIAGGGHLGRRADGRRRGRAGGARRPVGAADARRRGDGWRHPGQGPGQRARSHGRVFRRPQGGRIMHPTDFSLRGAIEALNEGLLTSVELTQAHLDGIAALNPRLNAYLTVTGEQALEQARASDARRAEGLAGPLDGIPLAIKDLFCTAGTRTTAGSRILGNFVPPYESTVSGNLLRDGAVFLGKVNLDEFAMGSSNTTSAFGPVENPWSRRNDPDARLVPGGSSGGSAAAVAARIAAGATATDTGGSIRQPAALPRTGGNKPAHRPRRLDPPARGLHRHGRHQAHLRPLLALGRRCLCFLPRPGWTDRSNG